MVAARVSSAHVGSDKSAQSIANDAQQRLAKISVKTLNITTGNPWGNGFSGLFNGSMRDALLNCETFQTLTKTQILIKARRRHYKYNNFRPISLSELSTVAYRNGNTT